MQQVNTSAYRQDTLWRYIISGCGLALIVLTIAIGAFLCYKGLGTFTTYNHSISEFLFRQIGRRVTVLMAAARLAQPSLSSVLLLPACWRWRLLHRSAWQPQFL